MSSEALLRPHAEPAAVLVHASGATDVGQLREHNEDSFLIVDIGEPKRVVTDARQAVGPRGLLLGVCDGMGGAAAGEIASALALDVVSQTMHLSSAAADDHAFARLLVRAIARAGWAIWRDATTNRSHRGMGTTATIAAILGTRIYFGQVGDSRAYVLRGERLIQVTRDQSLVNSLLEAGQLTEEEAEHFEHKNVILQALGTAGDDVQVDLTFVDLRRGDRLMLCSDGLNGMIRDSDIRAALLALDDPAEACRALIATANAAGGHDNITVVVAHIDGELDPPTADDTASLKLARHSAGAVRPFALGPHATPVIAGDAEVVGANDRDPADASDTAECAAPADADEPPPAASPPATDEEATVPATAIPGAAGRPPKTSLVLLILAIVAAAVVTLWWRS